MAPVFQNPTLLAALAVGVLSTFHCLGMCGGIVGALTMSLPTDQRRDPSRVIRFLIAFNAGRLFSYACAGAIVAGTGAGLADTISPRYGHIVLQIMATGFLAGLGLHTAGWLPQMARIESLGAGLWRRLEPIARRLLPVRSIGQAVLFGSIWGWFPCGLVYATLAWTMAAGSAPAGMTMMLAFGIGTLPGMISAGFLTRWLATLTRLPYLRQGVGLAILVLAVAGPLATSFHHATQAAAGSGPLIVMSDD